MAFGRGESKGTCKKRCDMCRKKADTFLKQGMHLCASCKRYAD
jgi:hypothetical protein